MEKPNVNCESSPVPPLVKSQLRVRVTRVRNVYMTGPDFDTLRKYGDGNLSAGVRRAADLVRLCTPDNG